jgi:type IV pilus assembly protein PilV
MRARIQTSCLNSALPGQRGVALLETLISILIFAFGVLGLLALEARAITFSVDSEDRNRAALFANEIASNMWLSSSITLSSAALTALQTRVASPTQGGLPNGTLTITPVTGTTNSTDIKITWQSPSHTADPAANQLTTRVTLP